MCCDWLFVHFPARAGSFAVHSESEEVLQDIPHLLDRAFGNNDVCFYLLRLRLVLFHLLQAGKQLLDQRVLLGENTIIMKLNHCNGFFYTTDNFFNMLIMLRITANGTIKRGCVDQIF